jgi:ribosomal protein S21
MGVKVHVAYREPIGQALRRFKRWVEYHRRFEKLSRRGPWWDGVSVYVKPGEARRWKKIVKRLEARSATARAKRAGEL